MSKAKKILYLICSIIIGFGIVFVSWNYFSDLGPVKREQNIAATYSSNLISSAFDSVINFIKDIFTSNESVTVAERTMIIEEINKHPVQATPEERFDIIEKINSF